MNGKEKRPVMLHRAIVGSTERFMMILIEHFGGAFPVWLSPAQAKVLPITSRVYKYAEDVTQKLKDLGIRVELDDRNETLGTKIRESQGQKIPYMLVIGDREKDAEQVAVRLRSGKDLGALPLNSFVNIIKERINQKSLDL